MHVSPSEPPRLSSAIEDGLLLREFSHRTFNEIAVASAAVELARRGSDALDRDAVLREAGSRLQDLSALLRVLARPVEHSVDLAAEIAELSRAMRAARPDAAAASLELDLVAFRMDGAAARRMSLVAAELMANAYRHALAGRRGGMSVRLRRSAGQAVLEVSDDGEGRSCGAAGLGGAGPGLGLGRGIVAELVSAAGGEVTLRTGPDGTTASVRMPVAAVVEAVANAR